MTVMTKPQQSVRLEPVHPKPEEAHTMPYAPAVRIVGAVSVAAERRTRLIGGEDE